MLASAGTTLPSNGESGSCSQRAHQGTNRVPSIDVQPGVENSPAAQTSLCAYLTVIALPGVGLNGAFGWWWADPAAALVMVPIIGKEGVEGLRGDAECECHAP